jgi:hypothetical protein
MHLGTANVQAGCMSAANPRWLSGVQHVAPASRGAGILQPTYMPGLINHSEDGSLAGLTIPFEHACTINGQQNIPVHDSGNLCATDLPPHLLDAATGAIPQAQRAPFQPLQPLANSLRHEASWGHGAPAPVQSSCADIAGLSGTSSAAQVPPLVSNGSTSAAPLAATSHIAPSFSALPFGVMMRSRGARQLVLQFAVAPLVEKAFVSIDRNAFEAFLYSSMQALDGFEGCVALNAPDSQAHVRFRGHGDAACYDV